MKPITSLMKPITLYTNLHIKNKPSPFLLVGVNYMDKWIPLSKHQILVKPFTWGIFEGFLYVFLGFSLSILIFFPSLFFNHFLI